MVPIENLRDNVRLLNSKASNIGTSLAIKKLLATRNKPLFCTYVNLNYFSEYFNIYHMNQPLRNENIYLPGSKINLIRQRHRDLKNLIGNY